MNKAINLEIRNSIQHCLDNNVGLCRGAWFCFDADGKVYSCDALGAVLISNSLLPSGIGLDPAALEYPGFTRSIAKVLNVDPWWVHRFHHGWDCSNVITFMDKRGDEWIESSRDDVSAYALQLYREYFKR